MTVLSYSTMVNIYYLILFILQTLRDSFDLGIIA